MLCWAALLYSPWILVIPLVQGAVRGFAGPHRLPSNKLWTWLLQRLGRAGRQEDAGAKMFAAKILFIASSVSLALYLAGSDLWRVPCTILVLFSFLEWALSFCAACWVYGAWYRRFPPRTS